MRNYQGLSVLFALGFVVAAGGCGGSAPPAASPTTASAAPAMADDDSDDDGVPDSVDKCPGKKEDGLGTEPKDGCPKG